MSGCKCEIIALGNTGVPNCQDLIGIDTKEFLVPTINSDGVRNSHDASVVIDAAFLEGKINEADPSKRWYPLPKIENPTSERTDPVTETSASGTIAFIKDGVRTETFELWNQSPTLIKALESAKCTDFSIYTVDDCGNLVGMCLDNTDFLYPIRIDKGSLSIQYVKKTPTTVGKVTISFQWLEIEKDSNLSMISADNITADLLGASGLLDIYGTCSNEALGAFDIELETIYGSKGAKIKDTGLVVGDFALLNVTTGLPVAITSVSEASGVYSFVFPDQTSGDVLQLTPTKIGRDYSEVVSKVITLP